MFSDFESLHDDTHFAPIVIFFLLAPSLGATVFISELNKHQKRVQQSSQPTSNDIHIALVPFLPTCPLSLLAYHNFHFRVKMTLKTSSETLKTCIMMSIFPLVSSSFMYPPPWVPQFPFQSKSDLKNETMKTLV